MVAAARDYVEGEQAFISYGTASNGWVRVRVRVSFISYSTASNGSHLLTNPNP